MRSRITNSRNNAIKKIGTRLKPNFLQGKNHKGAYCRAIYPLFSTRYRTFYKSLGQTKKISPNMFANPLVIGTGNLNMQESRFFQTVSTPRMNCNGGSPNHPFSCLRNRFNSMQ